MTLRQVAYIRLLAVWYYSSNDQQRAKKLDVYIKRIPTDQLDAVVLLDLSAEVDNRVSNVARMILQHHFPEDYHRSKDEFPTHLIGLFDEVFNIPSDSET